MECQVKNTKMMDQQNVSCAAISDERLDADVTELKLSMIEGTSQGSRGRRVSIKLNAASGKNISFDFDLETDAQVNNICFSEESATKPLQCTDQEMMPPQQKTQKFDDMVLECGGMNVPTVVVCNEQVDADIVVECDGPTSVVVMNQQAPAAGMQQQQEPPQQLEQQMAADFANLRSDDESSINEVVVEIVSSQENMITISGNNETSTTTVIIEESAIKINETSQETTEVTIVEESQPVAMSSTGCNVFVSEESTKVNKSGASIEVVVSEDVVAESSAVEMVTEVSVSATSTEPTISNEATEETSFTVESVDVVETSTDTANQDSSNQLETAAVTTETSIDSGCKLFDGVVADAEGYPIASEETAVPSGSTSASGEMSMESNATVVASLSSIAAAEIATQESVATEETILGSEIQESMLSSKTETVTTVTTITEEVITEEVTTYSEAVTDESSYASEAIMEEVTELQSEGSAQTTSSSSLLENSFIIVEENVGETESMASEQSTAADTSKPSCVTSACSSTSVGQNVTSSSSTFFGGCVTSACATVADKNTCTSEVGGAEIEVTATNTESKEVNGESIAVQCAAMSEVAADVIYTGAETTIATSMSNEGSSMSTECSSNFKETTFLACGSAQEAESSESVISITEGTGPSFATDTNVSWLMESMDNAGETSSLVASRSTSTSTLTEDNTSVELVTENTGDVGIKFMASEQSTDAASKPSCVKSACSSTSVGQNPMSSSSTLSGGCVTSACTTVANKNASSSSSSSSSSSQLFSFASGGCQGGCATSDTVIKENMSSSVGSRDKIINVVAHVRKRRQSRSPEPCPQMSMMPELPEFPMSPMSFSVGSSSVCNSRRSSLCVDWSRAVNDNVADHDVASVKEWHRREKSFSRLFSTIKNM